MHIHFWHQGKAIYPDIPAYRSFFADHFSTSEGLASDLPEGIETKQLIVWQMMGFYPLRPRARLVIHDYRSLSTGKIRRAKDLIKRAFNATPDLRIYQNEVIRDALRLGDDGHSVIVPMGVPSWIFELEWRKDFASYDFGYAGVISVERGFRQALRSFVDAYNGSRRWLLIGPTEQSLLDEFASRPELVFVGRLPQPEALQKLLSAQCGVALFPSHPPHCWQTPTKLLEYAAMGMPILANSSTMNAKTIEQHGIVATIRQGELFDGLVDPARLKPNVGSDFRHLDFRLILRQSGLLDAIWRRLAG